MGLKLTVGRGDSITIGDDVTATVRSISDKKVCLVFDAPRSVEIHTVFADEDRQDKNLRKAQGLSPEKQRENALNEFKNRGNRK